MLGNVSSVLEITRPPLCLISIFCVVEGYWLALHRYAVPNLQISMAALAAGMAIGFANTVNDLFDVETDKINYPNRPIPSGRLSVTQAKFLALSLCLAVIALSFIAGWQMVIIGIVGIGLSLVYNICAKKVPIVGKLLVAFLSSLTIIAGYFLVNNGDFPLIPFLSIQLFLIARDFAGSVSDIEGDHIGGRFSECALWGKKKTLSISLLLASLSGMVLAAGVYELKHIEPIIYLCSFLFLSVAPFLYIVLSVRRDSTPTNIRRVIVGSRWLFVSNIILFLLLV